MDRRSFLRVSAISAAGLLLPLGKLEGKTSENPKEWKRSGVSPSSWITPNERFYVQNIGQTPNVSADKWKLIVNGLVERPKIIRLGDARAKESVTQFRTLSCIGDPVGGDQIGNAEWKGVRVRDLLEEARVREQATRVVFKCADGYHTAIPVEDALHEDSILAYEMNGEPLPPDHGFPLRLLNPGKYGQKCPKWILNMELVEKEYLGYYETRGWSDEAAIRTATRVHFPGEREKIPVGTYRVSGSAFDGGNHGGVERVEASVDGGETWNNATIWASASPRSWSLWVYEWEVTDETESATVVARAVTRDGEIQTELRENAGPEGASGYHTVEVKIET